MRRNSRTPQPPIFTIDRPLGRAWTWDVLLSVASSGYVSGAHVTAHRVEDGEDLVGIAHCAVGLYDDTTEVIECLAIEAMLAACEPTLSGEIPRRAVIFSSNL